MYINYYINNIKRKKDQKHNNVDVFECIKNTNIKPIKNIKPKQFNSICFLIPQFLPRLAGGVSSVLRIGTYLSNKHNIDVYYCCYNRINEIDKLKDNAKQCISDYKGQFIEYNDAKQKAFDYVVATSWQSVYFSLDFIGYKVYFVQDYEPYFHEVGDQHVLAKMSYELGYHIITLGDWCAKRIIENKTKNKKIKIDVVQFPYEKKEYTNNNRQYTKKKDIKLAVYVKNSGRRLPFITQLILKQAKEELNKQGINLDIFIFGLDINEKVLVGTNLGMLNNKELLELYQRCDFGMVASMTNVSLVPYEMIATRLPVIDFNNGSLIDFLGKDGAIYISYDYSDLVNKLIYYSNKPSELKKMMKVANSKIKNVSWEETAKQFYEELINL